VVGYCKKRGNIRKIRLHYEFMNIHVCMLNTLIVIVVLIKVLCFGKLNV